MPYKDILVYLEDDKHCAQRTAAALDLAKRHDAHLKGVTFALNWPIPVYAGMELPVNFGSVQNDVVENTAKKVIAEFEQAAKEAGVEISHETIRCNMPQAAAYLAHQARHVDITFLGQPEPDDDETAFRETLLDGVLFASGRPIYALPFIGRPSMDIRKAVVAWDGSKKAARAINDAIPLLRDRAQVIVLVVDAEKRLDAHGENPGQDIAEHLRRHGIKTSVETTISGDLSVATTILNFISDNGADLLVMGAYGHSRLRERAFGGVTNTIMQQMTVPVLMSE